MSMQHTPGPWRIGDCWKTVFGPKCDRPAPVVIATLPPPTPRISQAERRANAKLIAAAPLMFAALNAIEALLDCEQPVDVPGALRTARSALAKATGLL